MYFLAFFYFGGYIHNKHRIYNAISSIDLLQNPTKFTINH